MSNISPRQKLSPGASAIQHQHDQNVRAEQRSSSTFCRCARIVPPLAGLLVAGAGAYALASGINRNNFDQADTYHLNLVNGLSGGAGAVGGALLSALGDYAVRAYCCVRDRSGEDSPARRLTLAGPVTEKDLEDPTTEPVSKRQVEPAQKRESKASEVELEPGMPLQETDFATGKSAEPQEHPSQPRPQATRKVPTGGIKLQEAPEIDGWIDFSKQLKAGHVVIDQS